MSFLFHRRKSDAKEATAASAASAAAAGGGSDQSSLSGAHESNSSSSSSSGLLSLKQSYSSSSKQEKRRNSNEKAAKRMWESQQSPNNILDVSECNLDEIPQETYSTCNTFRKDILLAHSNLIRKLDPAIGQLKHLKILDLHANQIEVIPVEIAQMKSLKSLDLSFNKLKKIPGEIGDLLSLYALRLRGNQLTKLPPQICKLHLLTLDVRENHLTELPAEMYKVTSLQELDLAGNTELVFPNASIIQSGTTAIMNALCLAQGVEYVPSTTVHNDGSENSLSSHSIHSLRNKQMEDEAMVERHLKERQLEMERLQQLHLQKEREFDEQVRQQRALDDHLRELRSQHYASVLAMNDKHTEALASDLAKKQMEDQRRLVGEILKAQTKEAAVMASIVSRLEEDRIGIAIQEQMQRDKQLLEAEISRSHDEFEKNKLLEMQLALQQREQAENKMQEARLDYEKKREEGMRRAQALQQEFQKQIDANLSAKDAQYEKLVQFLKAQEDKYHADFEAWQMEKDAKYAEISNTIRLIQSDLARLATAVRVRKEERNDADLDLISQEQQRLYHKLCLLIEQQQQREAELQEMMRDMDAEYQQQQKDLWRHEFAKLMSRRPNDISVVVTDISKPMGGLMAPSIATPHICDPGVVKKLESLGLAHLEPVFARERIDEAAWFHLTDIHLQAIGVTALGDRLKIMSTVPL